MHTLILNAVMRCADWCCDNSSRLHPKSGKNVNKVKISPPLLPRFYDPAPGLDLTNCFPVHLSTCYGRLILCFGTFERQPERWKGWGLKGQYTACFTASLPLALPPQPCSWAEPTPPSQAIEGTYRVTDWLGYTAYTRKSALAIVCPSRSLR